MSATSFGGSWNLVESDDADQKGIFNRYLIRNLTMTMVPFVKYLPFVPPSSFEIQPLVDRIVSTRREEVKKGIHKKDLLQIFIDANNADPIGFSNKHLTQEMIVFMFV